MKQRISPAKWLPYVAVVAVFALLSILYFLPQMEGNSMRMNDIAQYEGMTRDVQQHVKQYGEDPQWTGGAFSGMPAYTLYFAAPQRLIFKMTAPLRHNAPMTILLVSFIGFWLMLLMMGVNPWVALASSLAWGLSTYSIIILGEGHINKAWALAWAPMLFGAVYYTLRGGNLWLGAALSALFGSLELSANHPQITYYFLMVIAAFWINELVAAIRNKQSKALATLARRTGVLCVAALLALGTNAIPLYHTMDYTKDTMRGGSELASPDSEATNGLDLEYATAWSYGRGESINMLIANARGGTSAGGFSSDGQVADALRPYDARSLATQLPAYWGDQPMTAGPTYIGAVMFFLAILGLFMLEGRNKWWILIISIIALFLAWGSNFMWFTRLAFEILPGYNKFRAVSTTLVIIQWSIPLLAAICLSRLCCGKYDKSVLRRGMWWSIGITGGLALFTALFGGSIYDFSAPTDSQLSLPNDILAAMQSERASMLRADALRSVLLVALSGAAVWLFMLGKCKRGILVGVITLLTACDMIPIDLRYVNHDRFKVHPKEVFQPTAADLAIMQDTEPGYRVYNLSLSPFNDASTSYFHRSVGGYSAAKLSRYQDIIDRYLSQNDMEILSMLNTKYIILPAQKGAEPSVQRNPKANGAAWIVDEIVPTAGANDEIERLGTIDTKHQAVVDRQFADMLPQTITPDSTATIRLTDYTPNHLTYAYSSSQPSVAVFSEIYYPKGWTAYIDKQAAPHYRADYILRAMTLPAGDHTIEFRFRAPRFSLVAGITLVCSITVLLALVAAVAAVAIKKRKQNASSEQ